MDSQTFYERLRELSDEFNGTSSIVANSLYLRKASSAFELEAYLNNDNVAIEVNMLWGHKLITILMTIMLTIFVLIGLTTTGYQVIAYLGIIGYLLITIFSNSVINNSSQEYYKLLKSFDYNQNE